MAQAHNPHASWGCATKRAPLRCERANAAKSEVGLEGFRISMGMGYNFLATSYQGRGRALITHQFF